MDKKTNLEVKYMEFSRTKKFLEHCYIYVSIYLYPYLYLHPWKC